MGDLFPADKPDDDSRDAAYYAAYIEDWMRKLAAEEAGRG